MYELLCCLPNTFPKYPHFRTLTFYVTLPDKSMHLRNLSVL